MKVKVCQRPYLKQTISTVPKVKQSIPRLQILPVFLCVALGLLAFMYNTHPRLGKLFSSSSPYERNEKAASQKVSQSPVQNPVDVSHLVQDKLASEKSNSSQPTAEKSDESEKRKALEAERQSSEEKRPSVAVQSSQQRQVDRNSSSTKQQKPSLPQCERMIVFSAPRHGSTWLIDCIGRCKYSDGKTYGHTNFYAETWNPGLVGPLQDIGMEDAVKYVERNGSIKLFPMSFRRKPGGPEFVITKASKRGIPVVILTRNESDSFQSWKYAKETADWIQVRPEGNPGNKTVDENDESFKSFSSNLKSYFEKVRLLLQEAGATIVDEFAYEEIKDQEFIVAKNSGCYIHNCNFL